MELAAVPVDDTGNGFTPRPLPARKTGFTQRQILEFANIARRHLIAISYVSQDKVVFVPVMMGRAFGFILGLKSDYTDETWVSFDFADIIRKAGTMIHFRQKFWISWKYWRKMWLSSR